MFLVLCTHHPYRIYPNSAVMIARSTGHSRQVLKIVVSSVAGKHSGIIERARKAMVGFPGDIVIEWLNFEKCRPTAVDPGNLLVAT
jgi:hypothetical protein